MLVIWDHVPLSILPQLLLADVVIALGNISGRVVVFKMTPAVIILRCLARI